METQTPDWVHDPAFTQQTRQMINDLFDPKVWPIANAELHVALNWILDLPETGDEMLVPRFVESERF